MLNYRFIRSKLATISTKIPLNWSLISQRFLIAINFDFDWPQFIRVIQYSWKEETTSELFIESKSRSDYRLKAHVSHLFFFYFEFKYSERCEPFALLPRRLLLLCLKYWNSMLGVLLLFRDYMVRCIFEYFVQWRRVYCAVCVWRKI